MLDERQVFKQVNKLIVLMWRLGLGWLLNSWPSRLGRYAILVVRGRKSGLRRFAPINFAPGSGEFFCVAGYGAQTHWYRNLQAEPNIEVWLPDGWWVARAETVIEAESRLSIIREVLKNSGFAADSLAGIDPFSVSDQELETETSEYMAVRVELVARAQGRGGPSDLAWVWGVLVVAAVLWFVLSSGTTC